MQQASAEAEVVPCGGTIGSAQLLLLSGIGPAAHLRDLGIEVTADLPGVGVNLQNHLEVPIMYRAAQPVLPGVNNLSEIMALLRTSDRSASLPNWGTSGGWRL